MSDNARHINLDKSITYVYGGIGAQIERFDDTEWEIGCRYLPRWSIQHQIRNVFYRAAINFERRWNFNW